MDELKPCPEPASAEVTQADIDAAHEKTGYTQEYLETKAWEEELETFNRECRYFAAHRTASTAALQAKLDMAVEALEELGISHDHLAVWVSKQGKGYHMEAAQIASDNAHATLAAIQGDE